MENANVREFIETITYSEAYVLFHEKVYFFDGPIMFEPPMFSFRIYHMVFSEEKSAISQSLFMQTMGLAQKHV